MNKWVNLVGIMVLTVGLAACGGRGPASGQGAHGTGIGDQTRFSRLNMDKSYTTKAPHDQIYYFQFDGSRVASKYIPSLEAQARYLNEHPGARVLVAGHTDARGSREYNVALGERRANSVVDILRLAGVPARQIRVVSYGKERPAVLGENEQAYQYNRRVELTYEATK
ncbi:MAG: peptidoglycan-associated lipoprotein Pal [Legionellales bacterium]|nr:peptidoglycan-associated lipoprotein Pal [Legionellales bacterium]